MIHQKQYESWKILIGEIQGWLETWIKLEENPESGESTAFRIMKGALEVLAKSGKELSEDLVVKNDKLIERVIQLLILIYSTTKLSPC